MNERYARHSLINWFSQEGISKKSVCVVGAGAIGNEALKTLALLGVGKIDIIDFDEIEEHNLTRSVLFRSSDVGKNKAKVAALRVSELDPNLQVVAWPGNLSSYLTPKKAQKFDCVICCVDNFEARLALNEICRLASVDFINLGIDSQYAAIELFPFSAIKNVACYECNLPPSAYQKIAERYSCGYLKRVAFEEKKIPTTIVTSSVAGSLGVSFALRLGKRGTDASSKRVLIDTLTGHSSVTEELSKNLACPCCSGLPNSIEVFPTSKRANSTSLSDFAKNESTNDVSVRFSEPVFTHAKCSVCGFEPTNGMEPGTPASALDERVRFCASCGLDSIAIEFKQEFSLPELSELLRGNPVKVNFATVRSDDLFYCLSFEENHE